MGSEMCIRDRHAPLLRKVSCSREVKNLKRHNSHGRSTPRTRPEPTKTRDDALDLLNFSVCTPWTFEERRRHRAFGKTAAGYQALKDVFTGHRADWFDDISSRTLYFSRVERNRLAHSENGNTLSITPRSQPSSPQSYLSRSERNRLAHALNGNTTPRAETPTPEEIFFAAHVSATAARQVPCAHMGSKAVQ